MRTWQGDGLLVCHPNPAARIKALLLPTIEDLRKARYYADYLQEGGSAHEAPSGGVFAQPHGSAAKQKINSIRRLSSRPKPLPVVLNISRSTESDEATLGDSAQTQIYTPINLATSIHTITVFRFGRIKREPIRCGPTPVSLFERSLSRGSRCRPMQRS